MLAVGYDVDDYYYEELETIQLCASKFHLLNTNNLLESYYYKDKNYTTVYKLVLLKRNT